MTASYTNDPTNRPIDRVRLEIDDRDTIPETDALLTDEEIQYYIDTHSNILLAAAAAADQLSAQFAGDPMVKKVGDLAIEYGMENKSLTYKLVAMRLRGRVARRGEVSLFAGGLSKAAKRMERAKADKVQPSFTIGQDDNR